MMSPVSKWLDQSARRFLAYLIENNPGQSVHVKAGPDPMAKDPTVALFVRNKKRLWVCPEQWYGFAVYYGVEWTKGSEK